MKSKDLLKAIGDIDEKFIEEASYQEYKENTLNLDSDKTDGQDSIKLSEIRSKSKFKMAVSVAASIAACLCVVVVVTLMTFGTFNNQQISDGSSVRAGQKSASEQQKEVPSKDASMQNEESKDIYEIPKWNERSISQQYTQLNFNKLEYSGADVKISQEYIGEKLGTGELLGYDSECSVGEETHKKNGAVFAIRSIASKCAVAVKFEESDDYFIYRNSYYRPETLGDLIKDLSLKENMSFNSAKGLYENNTHISCDRIDKDEVWKILFSDESLKTEWDVPMTEEAEDIVNISVNIPIVGHENIALWITKNGYLCTNIMDTQKRFNIGNSKAQAFIDYIMKNGKVHEDTQNNSSATSNDNVSSEAVSNFKITKDTAFQIALREAKKHADEYELIIPEDIDFQHFSYEVKYKNGSPYYAVAINNLMMTDNICVSGIGIDVDAQTGAVLSVNRYK